MPVHELQQRIARPVGGQRVGGGVVAVEPVLAVLVGAKLAAQVVGGLVVRVLEVVLAVGAGLPDVEDGVGDGLAGEEVGDGAVHAADLAAGGRVLDDGGAVVAEGGVGGPEGAEDGGGGRVNVAFCDDFVCDFVDEAAYKQSWLVARLPKWQQYEKRAVVVLTTRGPERQTRGAPRCASWSSTGRRH